jgi:hypothetical protein
MPNPRFFCKFLYNDKLQRLFSKGSKKIDKRIRFSWNTIYNKKYKNINEKLSIDKRCYEINKA